MKPALPLGPLSEGVGDVAPTRLQIALNTPFGFAETYDFENPRGLAAGRFDLSFALVYLPPIGLILLFGLLGTVERDRGMLRLIAAQGTGARLWLGARIAAIASWTLPGVLGAVVVALAAAGADLAAAWGELFASLGLIAAYILFWTGLAAVVLSRVPRAAAAVGMQTGLWLVLVLGVPIAGTLLARLADPAPSPVAAIDVERRVKDALQADRDQIIVQAFSARADLRGAEDKIATLDHATRLTFLTPETERRLAPLGIAFQAHRERQNRLSDIAGYVSPPLGLEAGLALLAGTDQARHRRFEEQARGYQLLLRERFYPLVQRQIVSPSPVAEPARRGRFSHDPSVSLPTFDMREVSVAERVGAVVPMAVWFAALGAALGVLGLRLASWPPDL
jgi:ABC-2 type transport system permease protein